MLKVNNRNTRAICDICLKLIINTLERRNWCPSDTFIVNFEQISYVFLIFPLFTLKNSILVGCNQLPESTTHQMNFSVKTFLLKCGRIPWKLQICSGRLSRKLTTSTITSTMVLNYYTVLFTVTELLAHKPHQPTSLNFLSLNPLPYCFVK